MKYMTSDLRERVEQHLGKPLAASAYAGLWRCPACPPERHALLMVAADDYRCLSGYSCDGGASEWMTTLDPTPDESFAVGALA
ncbi:hypothetical protein FBR02_13790 [Anaerolineae bacterium CFX9]|nr:hypothetical protein [Anaerolineae bacterium]MDL1901832.1 hypothetical protein [Anaerolineae bacterium CFX9]NOG48792.1 hypothetical protein [Chloroflexota bacterium]GIK28169.1 MAG: hypothetical protein BroJett007_13070 [Chloroflexota bacterium]